MTTDELLAKTAELQEHLMRTNALARELWEAGCHVTSRLAPIVSGGLFDGRHSPAFIAVDVYLPSR